MPLPDRSMSWPALPYAGLRPTLETLQLFAQVAGKVRLAGTPWLNHSWHVTFTVSARGLITALIPHGDFSFDIEFDFVSDRVELRTTNGTRAAVALTARSVATFYAEFCDALDSLGIAIKIDRLPNELPDPAPFHEDNTMRAYAADAARRFWRALVEAERVLQRFRTRFIGKSSPVHFFWGSFDLAVTRFSGRRVLPRRGSSRMPRGSIRAWANFSCPMRPSAKRTIPTRCCSIFYRARTKPPPI